MSLITDGRLPLQYAVALAACAVAAAWDIRKGIIPDWLTLTLLAAAMVYATLTGGFAGFLSSLGGAAVLGIVPFILFMKNAMGGGDVKLLAAMGAIYGAGTGLRFEFAALIIVSLWGIGRMAAARISRSSKKGRIEARFAPSALAASVVILIENARGFDGMWS